MTIFAPGSIEHARGTIYLYVLTSEFLGESSKYLTWKMLREGISDLIYPSTMIHSSYPDSLGSRV